MNDIVEIKRKRKEDEAINDANIRSFIEEYNRKVVLHSSVIDDLKPVIEWIVKNKNKRNFIKRNGFFGKKAQSEFNDKMEALDLKYGFYIFAIVELSPYINISVTFSIKNSKSYLLKTYTSFVRIKYSVYYNQYSKTIDSQTLSETTMDEITADRKRITEIDKTVTELRHERSELFNKNAVLHENLF